MAIEYSWVDFSMWQSSLFWYTVLQYSERPLYNDCISTSRERERISLDGLGIFVAVLLQVKVLAGPVFDVRSGPILDDGMPW